MANRGRHRKSEIPTSLRHFPKRILDRLMECQVEQGNKADLTVFLRNISANKYRGGFDWERTTEGYAVWYNRLLNHSPI